MNLSASIVTLACVMFAVSVATSRAASIAEPPPREQPARTPGGPKGERVNLRPKFVTGDVHSFMMVITNTGTVITPANTGTPTDTSSPGTQPRDPFSQPPTPRVPVDPSKRSPQNPSPLTTPTNPTTTPPTGKLGLGERTSMEQRIGLRLKVTDAKPEGESAFDLIFDSITLTIKTPEGETLTFDSTSTGDDPLSGVLAPLIGQAISIRMDKDGNVTSAGMGTLGGLDPAALTSALTGSGGNNAPNATDIFKNMLGPISSANKTKGEANIGESWTHKDQIQAPWGEMRLTTRHTLTSHRNQIASIDMVGQYDLEPSSSSSGMAPRIRESIYKGQTLWNTGKGILDSLTFTQKLVVESSKAGTSSNEMRVNVTRNK